MEQPSAGIVIVGGGYAGTWAAMGAASLADRLGRQVSIELVAPDDHLTARPRLYEADLSPARVPLLPTLNAIGATFRRGKMQSVDPGAKRILLEDGSTLSFDRVILALGSRAYRPPIPGLETYAHSVDTFEEATRFRKHLAHSRPGVVAVVGASFTGIELATELASVTRVILVERADAIGPELGSLARPPIKAALDQLRIETMLNAEVVTIDGMGIQLADGRRIDVPTVVWTSGLRAHPLTDRLEARKDNLGRFFVSPTLEIPEAPGVYAAGDVAHAMTDETHVSLMSCQHALYMGKFAGYNAAASLLGMPQRPYRQERYVTCLDLGGAGALFCEGWERKPVQTGPDGQRVKRQIVEELIVPPRERAAALKAGIPELLVERLNQP